MKRRSKRLLVTAASFATLKVAAVSALANPAIAAVSPYPSASLPTTIPEDAQRLDSESLTFTPSSTTSSTAAAAAAPPIDCTLTINDPHDSHHVNGTVNGTAKVTCSGGPPMPSIFLSVALFRDGNLLPGAYNNTGTNVYSWSGNHGVPCVAGTYVTGSRTRVLAPMGYSPAVWETSTLFSTHDMKTLCD
jgi:hypothetical protein